MSPPGAPAPARLDELDLAGVAARAAACELCRLCRTRSNVVFGAGNPAADVMFVGEGPGYHDDRAGSPFTGAAGELLDTLLSEVGMRRDDVWLTSVVKCRTPGNRTPFPDEIEQCEGYLFREVQLVQPRVICTLGNVAIRLLTGKSHRLSHVHGTPMPIQASGREVIVYPLYHPAAVVQVPILLDALREDVRRLPQLLRGGMPSPSSPATISAAGVPATPAPTTGDDDRDQLALPLA